MLGPGSSAVQARLNQHDASRKQAARKQAGESKQAESNKRGPGRIRAAD
jgi:hypothetical protein